MCEEEKRSVAAVRRSSSEEGEEEQLQQQEEKPIKTRVTKQESETAQKINMLELLHWYASSFLLSENRQL